VTVPRVVSLVPSATETLRAWGVDPVAVTRFCEQPDLPTVGGTKDPDIDAVIGLAPELVVMCVEENRRDDAAALQHAGLDLFVFDIDRVEDVEPQLRALAERLGVAIPPRGRSDPPPPVVSRAFVPIWRRPWMTLRATTYGSSVLRHLGIENVFGEAPDRYPEITLDEAERRRPDVVLAPSEPYPFAERHRSELEVVAPVVFVDGKDLFWWGVRTPAALARLGEQALDPST
jgi:ABC-type Fe3+-hydroxamate transport system substrate-binding protein